MAIDIDQSFYKTGTATVANGSTVVTGQGTLWTQTCRAGDLFGTHVGDGTRILSIESNTSLTLAYPWQGDAQTASAYEIQFTPYDTGYQAAVRQLLSFLTSGNIESFGELVGFDGGVPVFSGPGVLGLVDKSEFITPDPNGNLAELSGLPNVDNLTELGLLTKQNDQFIVMGNDGSIEVLSGDIGYNILGNIPDAFISTTLPQAKAYRRGNAVGNVSQVDGVPTGALIQRGGNANGQFARFADGTQICWHTIMAGVTTATVGSLFMTSGMTWTFPSVFSDRPTIGGACYKISGGGVTMLGGPLGTPSTTAMNNIRGVSTHADSDTELFIFAMGRWF